MFSSGSPLVSRPSNIKSPLLLRERCNEIFTESARYWRGQLSLEMSEEEEEPLRVTRWGCQGISVAITERTCEESVAGGVSKESSKCIMSCTSWAHSGQYSMCLLVYMALSSGSWF